ncbi:MAG: YbhB/YbcL family Raf kinase inhibitor-like protein [Candidatus Woesearchaeota archaeon]
MKLSSSAFANNGKIPSKYTCDGENINPPLEFSNVPANAKSLVLIMDDPDIPGFVKQKFGISVWDHWIVFNIPPNTKKIEENQEPQGIKGITTSKTLKYNGPCPPDKEHRYFFKLYALDKMLDLKEGATKEQVLEAIKGHVLAEAELMGRYQRK